MEGFPVQRFRYSRLLVLGSYFLFTNSCISANKTPENAIQEPTDKATRCYPPQDQVGAHKQIGEPVPCKLFYFSPTNSNNNMSQNHKTIAFYFDLFTKKHNVGLKNIIEWLKTGGQSSKTYKFSEKWKSCILSESKGKDLTGACLNEEFLVVFSSLPNINKNTKLTTVADLERLVTSEKFVYNSEQSRDLMENAKLIEGGLKSLEIPYESRGLTITFFQD
jgi:hypothetical protein